MQVNHIADHVNHAVIGNQKARDFGISDSAEFFNILSNTLYSDKILAVVREVLCNAWDIHIQTGRIDTPVEITLDDNKLIIRDFGTGISDDDIHPIYAVYGNSTKKLDGKQTGGFGLGSKAPFAYVDHFEVISFYKGMKTIYAVSKSSAEVGGKPSIMPLVSVPCGEETGLQVSFNIQYTDKHRFQEIINTIARFGEMNVKLNDTSIPTIPFSEAKHDFLMIPNMDKFLNVQNNIFVRYGNVVYPVPQHEKINSKLGHINKVLDRINGRRAYSHYSNENWKIIFQAKPDTISVTPSRESLSMTDHTVNNLNEIFKTFDHYLSNNLQKECINIESEAIARIWKEGRHSDLLTSNNKIPDLFSDDLIKKTLIEVPKYISDTKNIARAYMSRSYPDFPEFHKQDIKMRLDTLSSGGFGGPTNRGKIQSFWRQYELIGNKVSSEWFQRTLVQPLIRKLDVVPELSGSKLLVYGAHTDRSVDKNGRRRNWNDTGIRFTEASKLSSRNFEDYLPFLRNFVVISFNRLDVEERLHNFPQMKKIYGKNNDFFVYIVSRTDKKIDIVRQFFKDQGIGVVDLTVRGSWEPKHILEPIAKPAVSKPRKKGLPRLDSILFGSEIDYKRLLPNGGVYDTLIRIEDPQFITKLNPRSSSVSLLSHLSTSAKIEAIKLYGTLGGVVVNESQHYKFHSMNIPDFHKWLEDKLKDEIKNNPRIQIGLMTSPSKLETLYPGRMNSGMIRFFRTIVMSQELALEFNILNEMTPNDRKLINIINEYNIQYRYNHNQEIAKLVNEINVTDELKELAIKIASSKTIDLLDSDSYSRIFSDTATERQKKQKSEALDILLYSLS